MISILSIDGGGIRGIIPATMLAYIEKQTGQPICKLFDYIAGTSTGGIIATMLTTPDNKGNPKYTAEQIKSIYIKFGSTVFHQSILRKIITLDGLIRPRYPVRTIEKFFKEYLDNVRLHSTLTNIIIPTYDMQNCTPWFFKTSHAYNHRSYIDDPLLSQIVQATSAAPTFFRPFKMFPNHCFIDGGVFANNPTLCAYAEARKSFPNEKEFLIVSLGTGEHIKKYSCEQMKRRGILKWTIPLFGVIMNSASATVDYQIRSLVGNRNYYRFQVRLDRKSTEIDNASYKNIRRLEKFAHIEIEQNSKKVRELCNILSAKSN